MLPVQLSIVAPENENPNTTAPPADTVKPASAAAPPLEPVIVPPSTLN